MLPPRSGRATDTSDEPKKPSSFRLPQSIKDYLANSEASGYSQTEVVVMAIEMIRDVAEVMGDDWWDVLKQASIKKVSYGKVLGSLALEGLRSTAASNNKKK